MGKHNKGMKHLTKFCDPCSLLPIITSIDKPSIWAGRNILEELTLGIEDSGLYLGLESGYGKGYYVGKKSTTDGNALIIGTNGSGKSYICAMSTIETWQDPFVTLDCKSELYFHYRHLQHKGRAKRECLLFDPINDGIHYDPYALLKKDNLHFVEYVREIAYTIIPMPPNDPNSYWINMARDLLSAIIIYGFSIDMDFIETMITAVKLPVSELCKQIEQSDFETAKMLISEIANLKKEHQATIGTEMKQHLMVFATDPCIQTALCNDNSQKSFSWDDIVTTEEAPNVFLCLSQDRLEQWNGVIRLMLTQLIRTLERRPDKQSPQSRNTKPFLLLLDEFPLLGKMEVITNALTTLRSKKVTFCLMLQSIAQLDAIYGHDIRKIIVDNCQYKAILNITEPDSQEYFSKLIGSVPYAQRSISQIYDPRTEQSTFGRQIQELREPLIHPHEFTTNRDIWLHTPYGFFSTIKLPVSETRKHVYDFDRILQQYEEANKYDE